MFVNMKSMFKQFRYNDLVSVVVAITCTLKKMQQHCNISHTCQHQRCIPIRLPYSTMSSYKNSPHSEAVMKRGSGDNIQEFSLSFSLSKISVTVQQSPTKSKIMIPKILCLSLCLQITYSLIYQLPLFMTVNVTIPVFRLSSLGGQPFCTAAISFRAI